MQVGCCTSLDNYLAVQEVGFDYIEVSGRALGTLCESDFLDFYTLLTRNELPCLALNAYCPTEVVIAGPGFDISKPRAYAEKIVQRASKIGIKVVNIGSPKSRSLPNGFDYDLALFQARSFFYDTAEVFRPYGISITVEALGNCFCNFINTLDEAESFLESLYPVENMGLVVDFYNMRQSNDTDVDLCRFGNQIFHAHDSDDLNDPYLRSFYKTENADVHQKDIQRLKVIGYKGGISIETDVAFDKEAAFYSLNLIRQIWNLNPIDQVQ